MKITFENKESLVDRPAARKFKVTAEDLNEIKQAHNATIEGLGWEEYRDTLHTLQSPQVFSAGAPSKLTIDGESVILIQAPKESPGLWDAEENKIRPIKLGDSYIVRIDFEAKIDSNSGFFDFSLNIGGAIGKAFGEIKLFPKGMNVDHNFCVDFPIYTLGTFIENGGELIIEASHTMQVFNKRIIIFKILDGKDGVQ